MIRKTEQLEVNGVTVRAEEHGWNIKWYTISQRAASRIMRKVFPRKGLPIPGYEVILPDSIHRGHPGRWALINSAGDFAGRPGEYELLFHYR